MTAPRVCPDPWSALEDEVCELAAGYHGSPVSFAARLFVVSTVLAAGVVGAALGWLLAAWRGWR